VAGKTSLYGYHRVCIGINLLYWPQGFSIGPKDFTPVSGRLYRYRVFSIGIIPFVPGEKDYFGKNRI
jgi:hypothetical protein